MPKRHARLISYVCVNDSCYKYIRFIVFVDIIQGKEFHRISFLLYRKNVILFSKRTDLQRKFIVIVICKMKLIMYNFI